LAGTAINLSTTTNHGDWQLLTGLGAFTNSGNGAASYTFSNETKAIFGLTNSYIETTNINVAAGSYTEKSGAAATCTAADYTSGTTCDANLTFSQAGFRFVDSNNVAISAQTAGTTSGTYYLQAVQNTCTTPGSCTGVCTSLFKAGTAVDIGLAYECRDPSSCQSGQTLTFTPDSAAGSASTPTANASGAVTATSAASTYLTSSLKFSSVSPNPLPAVPFTVNYTDVGKIRLWARYPATSASPTVSGSSAEFVVKPAGFVLTEIKPTSNQLGRCSVATTPAPTIVCSSTAAGSALFAKAGEAFSVTVTAKNSQGNATPNFGKESTAATVALTPAAVLSGMTNVPSISGTFGTFSGGMASGSSFSWGDVGVITLTPSVADYLGGGGVTGTTSSSIGRFVPDHIDAVVTEACASGFTYSRQPFALDLTARNLANGVTVNYGATSALSRDITLSPTVVPTSGGGSFTSGGTVAKSGFGAGTYTIAKTSAAAPVFAFSSEPSVPTVVTVGGKDSDNVPLVAALDTTKKQTVSIRSGRLFLSNAYGSEFLPLPITFQAQYWDNGWRLNKLDNSCSTVTRPTEANGGLLLQAQTARNQLSTGEIVAQLNGSISSTSAQLSNGSLVLVLRNPTSSTQGPGVGNYGYVDLIGSSITPSTAWLPSNTARACFGACGPRSPVIYMREMY